MKVAFCCPFVGSSSSTAGESRVDGAQSFLACHREVCRALFCPSFIPVKCLSWWRVENRLYAYADSPLQAVVRKPAGRPAVAASLNRKLARIEEWYNHWCMIRNPNKIKAFVVSRCRGVNLPHGGLVLSWVFICAISNLDILGVKFDRRLTFEDDVRGIVSQRIGILRLVKRVLVDTSVLLR